MKTIWNSSRKKLKNNLGMTLAEMLIVIAIIAVLAGVAFIAFWNHMRSLGQLERDGIAKEIFVAAQNHLTMVYGENYLGTEEAQFGSKEAPETSGICYFAVNQGTGANGSTGFTQAGTSVLDQMLPFGSIDETVRAGGSYVIRYQKSTGTVLDVFYCSGNGSRYDHKFFQDGDSYNKVLSSKGSDHKGARRKYIKGSILGWYGGAAPSNLETIKLTAPTINVTNAEKLSVQITDGNAAALSGKYSIKLVITGEISGAQKGFVVLKSTNSTETVDASGRLFTESSYTVVLDDITSASLHFAQLGTDNTKYFIPGEDVRIQAIAYSTEAFANVAYSAEKTENSLFAGIGDVALDAFGKKDGIPETAYIGNIRHLENLDKQVSKLDQNDSDSKLDISAAVQTANMSWSTFKTKINGDSTTISYWQADGNSAQTAAGSYYSVSPNYSLAYDGKNHSISDVTVSGQEYAGLFGKSSGSGKLHAVNLELIDFSISGTVCAGALAGKLDGLSTDTIVSNVMARNSTDTITEKKITASGSSGIAGGLVGLFDGGIIEYSAAALIVEGSSSAGGLIGTAGTGTTVSACYSGGHMEESGIGAEKKVFYSATNYNVKSESGTAGGLIGNAGSASITNSYSTCSVSGSTAGGFVGSASSGSKITHCYCTGLVYPEKNSAGTTAVIVNNAFIGTGTVTVDTASDKKSYYFKAVNEVVTEEGGRITAVEYKEPGNSNVAALDETAVSYNAFVGAESGWKSASAYSVALRSYYGGRYNLQTVEQLEGASWDSDTTKSSYFVRTHYGDWPAPEVFVINKAD